VYINATHRPLSGTSMAAPHVAALAARYGSVATTPVEREQYIRAKMFATGFAEFSGQHMPIMVPSLAQVPSFTIPARLPVFGVTDESQCNGTGCASTFDSIYLSLDVWNAGHGAPAWIEYDLGSTKTLTSIRLTTEQSPEGNAVHRIYAGDTPAPTTLVGTILGYGRTLEPLAAELGGSARYVRVLTESSPSWVAWREVEIYGY
jgi:hypothetical protein